MTIENHPAADLTTDSANAGLYRGIPGYPDRPGKIIAVEKGAVNGIVQIEIAPGVIMTADITNTSIDELGLEVGGAAIAVVKASSVMVGVDN